MPKSRTSYLSRRGLIAAGGALGLVAALSACGGTESAKGETGKDKDKGAAASGPWTFKDDLGKDISLKAAPKNIVAYTGTAAALYDYGVQVKGVFGPTKTADGKPDVQAGSMDISKVEILGNVYDEFNVEKYAALQPELLVTNTWDGTYWYVPEASKDKILKLAPAAAIGVGGDASLDKSLERTADLAKSLGADLNSKKTADAKARFEAAAAKVREATRPTRASRCSSAPAPPTCSTSPPRRPPPTSSTSRPSASSSSPRTRTSWTRAASSRASAGRTPASTRPTWSCSTTAPAPSSRRS